MRLHCEFCSICPKFIADSIDKTRCQYCGHAACWHKNDTTQFNSCRESAHKAIYEISRLLPEVPPLPLCDNFIRLPV